MTDNKKTDTPGAPDRPADAASGKRTYATIDLKASEVRVDKDAKASVGAAATASAAASAAAGSVPNTASKDAAAAKDAGTAKATTATPTPAAARGGVGALLSHFAAGIAGAFVALFGATQILPQLGGAMPASTATLPAEVTQRLATLEQLARAGSPVAAGENNARLNAAEARLAKLTDIERALAALGEVQGRLATETKSLDARIGTGLPDAPQRLARLEETLSALSAAASADPARAGRIPQLAQMASKLAELETALAARTTALRKDIVQDVEQRVAAIADGSEAAKAGTARLDRELGTVKTDAARLGQRLDTLKSGSDKLEQSLRLMQEDASGVKSTVDGLKTDLGQRTKSADLAAAIAPVAARIAGVEQSLQGVVKSEQERNTTAEKIVLSLELANLKRALDRGVRFDAELAAVKKLSGNRLDLGVLEDAKDRGVPTVSDLTTEFRRLANAMLDADAQPADAGVVDRVLAGAKSIVRIRKVKHADDDTSTEARIGRMETALKENRLVDVIGEGGKLSPRALGPAGDWFRKVEARAAIDKAIGVLEAQLKTTLAGGDAQKGTK